MSVPSPLIHYCCRLLTFPSSMCLAKWTLNSCHVHTYITEIREEYWEFGGEGSVKTQGRSESTGVCFDIRGLSGRKSSRKCLLFPYDRAGYFPDSGLQPGISETRFWDEFSDVPTSSLLPHCSVPAAACSLLSGPQKVQVRKSVVLISTPCLLHRRQDTCSPLHFISRRWYIILKALFTLPFSKLCGIFLCAISQLLHVVSSNSPT